MITNISEEGIYIEHANKGENEGIFVNGENIVEKTRLRNRDRVIFGMHSSFLVFLPEEMEKESEN